MAALPSPTQIAGLHYSIYETYFTQLEKHGAISSVVGAKFLKTSGLPETTLSKIWDASDPNSKGYLTKSGFFAALKLVTLAQLGHEVTIAKVLMNAPPPVMGSLLKESHPKINSVSPTAKDWSVKANEKEKYDQLFDSLQPLNGVISGDKVKGLLIDSKLPVPTLSRIWDLADMDKDGSLDRHEFIVAMHLVYKALEKYTIPNTLPRELLPPNKRKNSVPSNSSQPLVNGGVSWVVTPEDKTKYDQLFQLADLDLDGYVSGAEIRDIFLKSGVAQPVLASIWGLCDIKQCGKLNADQFALAMWLISQKLKGIEPPVTLAPDMIPPSMRPVLNQEPVVTPYSNPELNMISKDIEELSKEKQVLDGEILQKEAEIKIKISVATSLQGELETLVATLNQLENQKGEAHKRLNDLKNQTVEWGKKLISLGSMIELEQSQVDKLRKDAEEQAIIVRSQEDELINRRKELDSLMVEENKLKTENMEQSKKLNVLCNCLQESQLNISQIRSVILDIQEHQNHILEAIEFIDVAIENNDSTTVPNRFLDLEPQFRDPAYSRLINKTENANNVNEMANGTQNIDFSENAFKDDPFSSCHTKFSSAFSQSTTESEFDQNDPFTTLNRTLPSGKTDPFDPFGSDGITKNIKSEDDFSSDPFGCEPFEVAAPALPPKNKQPPPRPAPPRPVPPSSTSTVTASTNNPNPNQTDAFADFTNFNSKFYNLKNSMSDINSNQFTTQIITTTAATTTTAPSSAALSSSIKNITNANKNNNTNNNNLNQVNSPSKDTDTSEFEFTEDPFKDYRYEDTFDYSDDPFDNNDQTSNY